MNENQLVFLISQPRSGSSLTQQLLLNSKGITSAPESWQMLSLIHTYKKTNNSDGYNPKQTSINFLDYLNNIDHGLDIFKQQIKDLALKLYAYNTNGDCYFLDKTPRYYHIINELYELFPQAKFVFLVRNPLSVFASILDHNFKGNYVKFLSSKDRVEDLFTAPVEINKALKTYNNKILVKYEDLIENPEQELLKIFNYLELELPQDVETYKVKDTFSNTEAIDTKSLKKHSKPSDSYLNSWKKTINNTQKKKLALDYIEALSIKHVDYFGYDLKDLSNKLRAFRPEKRTLINLSLNSLICEDAQLPFIRLLKKRIILKLQGNHYV